MKHLWGWCIGCFVVFGCCVLVWAQTSSDHANRQVAVRILGDVNADGLSNISDALIVATYGLDTTIVIPNQGDILLGDVNGDRLVNVSDALIIATFGVNPNHSGLPQGIGLPVDIGGGIADTTANNPVVGPNHLPVLVSPGVHVAPFGIPFSLSLSASDPDGDLLTFEVENLPEGAVFANGVLHWTPTFDQLEEFELSFSASDGKGGVAQTTATLAVVDYNFLMRRYFLETQLPSFVNIIFQVTDQEGRGIDNFAQGHFEVRENNQLLSPSESSLQIRGLDAVPQQLKTVLVLDNSLSIGNDLAQVKNAAIALVQNVQPQQEYAIYEFSENPTLLQDFTGDPARLTAAIQRIELGLPTTNLYGAVIAGLSQWVNTFSLEMIQQGFLIVFTDGRDTQSLHTIQQVLFDRSGKRIYTVGLGNEIDAAVLSEMGNAGFFQIQDVNQLADRFARIQDHIALSSRGFYGLQYLSPTRGDRAQRLRVVIHNNKNRSHLEEPFVSTGFYSVRQGVYINTSTTLVEGIDSLLLSLGDKRLLRASTFLGSQTSEYAWQISDGDAILLVPDALDHSIAQIEVKKKQPPITTITVSDLANDLHRVLPVMVSQTTQDTLVTLPGGATMKMIYIEPGEFKMGSSRGDTDELPVHGVTLSQAYYLGQFEVTQHQWKTVMGTQPWQGKKDAVSDSLNPAAYVSWQDVQAFMQKLNEAEGQALYRLPTEAEWEYACRAGSQSRWSFGDDESLLGNFAWFVNNAWFKDENYGHPIGALSPNAWRLYDMHGNMMEWCHDWYASNYVNGAQIDPQGVTRGFERVLRGGCFACTSDRTRSADRHFSDPNTRSHVIGFRVLRRTP